MFSISFQWGRQISIIMSMIPLSASLLSLKELRKWQHHFTVARKLGCEALDRRALAGVGVLKGCSAWERDAFSRAPLQKGSNTLRWMQNVWDDGIQEIMWCSLQRECVSPTTPGFPLPLNSLLLGVNLSRSFCKNHCHVNRHGGATQLCLSQKKWFCGLSQYRNPVTIKHRCEVWKLPAKEPFCPRKNSWTS